MSGKLITEDSNGEPIYEGDTVVDEDNHETIVEYGKHIDRMGGGYILGYYIPKFCIKK